MQRIGLKLKRPARRTSSRGRKKKFWGEHYFWAVTVVYHMLYLRNNDDYPKFLHLAQVTHYLKEVNFLKNSIDWNIFARTSLRTVNLKVSQQFSSGLILQSRTSVGTRSKFSLPSTFNVDNQVIFFPFLLEKRNIFQHGLGGLGIRDTAQVFQLLLVGIVTKLLCFCVLGLFLMINLRMISMFVFSLNMSQQ